MLLLVLFCKTPINLNILFYLAKNCDISGEINVKMCTIEKSKKIHNEKIMS